MSDVGRYSARPSHNLQILLVIIHLASCVCLKFDSSSPFVPFCSLGLSSSFEKLCARRLLETRFLLFVSSFISTSPLNPSVTFWTAVIATSGSADWKYAHSCRSDPSIGGRELLLSAHTDETSDHKQQSYDGPFCPYSESGDALGSPFCAWALARGGLDPAGPGSVSASAGAFNLFELLKFYLLFREEACVGSQVATWSYSLASPSLPPGRPFILAVAAYHSADNRVFHPLCSSSRPAAHLLRPSGLYDPVEGISCCLAAHLGAWLSHSRIWCLCLNLYFFYTYTVVLIFTQILMAIWFEITFRKQKRYLQKSY